MNRILIMKVAMLGLSLLTIYPQSVMAQENSLLTSAILMQDTDVDKSYIKMQYIHPKYDAYYYNGKRVNEIAAYSGTYNIFGSFPMGENSAIQITLPYHAFKETRKYERSGGLETYEREKTGIGNVRLSVVQAKSESSSNWQRHTSIGASIPTASDETSDGIFVNNYDRFSYWDESMALHGSIINVKRSEKMTLSIEYGSDFVLGVGEDLGENAFYIHYGIGVAITPMTNLSLRGEWVGLGIIGWQHQLAIGARYQAGRFVPGLFWMKNMGDLGDFHESAIGFELGVDL